MVFFAQYFRGSKVAGKYRRNPFGYDGSMPTSHHIQELLPQVLGTLKERYTAQPQLLLDQWPSIIGPQLAPLTRAVRFDEGVLYVNVKNSTLLSLLHSPVDKKKMIEAVKSALQGIQIRNIVFRIG